MATIREISQRAGVSIATVSKVLNGKPGVNQNTANEILEIADSLNYRPNLNARFLKSGKSKTLGIITEDLTVFNSPEIVDGIAVACEEHSYHYILGNLRYFKNYGRTPYLHAESIERLRQEINDMLSKQVDGIIYIGCHSHVVTSLTDFADIPFVCAYCTCNSPNVPSVFYDDQRASFEATQVLLKKGITKIGMITGLVHSIHTINRTSGFQDALYDAGILYNPHFTVHGNWERESGYSAAQELIGKGVDAIFSHNDRMAAGVIDWCIEHDIAVGKDFFLIGFDNSEVSTFLRPTLSTVAPPLFEIGYTAGNTLLNIVTENGIPAEKKIPLKCTIIERHSTGVE